PARGNGDDLARLGIAPRTRRLVANLEVAESRQLHRVALSERIADLLEKAVDDVLGFALVQAYALEQQFRQFGLGECTRLLQHGQTPSSALAHAVRAHKRIQKTVDALLHPLIVQRGLRI